MGHYAMAIGMDTAQEAPGDALEYTAVARRAAYILGCGGSSGHHQRRLLLRHRHARFLARISEVSRARHALHGRARLFQAHHRSIPISWKPQAPPPRITSGRSFTSRTRNSRSALQVSLDFQRNRSSPAAIPVIGNTYAGAAVIGLTATLDLAQPGSHPDGLLRLRAGPTLSTSSSRTR